MQREAGMENRKLRNNAYCRCLQGLRTNGVFLYRKDEEEKKSIG